MVGVILEYPGVGREAAKRVLQGVTEDHVEANPTLVRRTWNGRLMRLPAVAPTRLRIDLSNAGDRVWSPRIDGLVAGSPIVLTSSVWMGAQIGPDMHSVDLRFDPAFRGQPFTRPDVYTPHAAIGRYLHVRDLAGREVEFFYNSDLPRLVSASKAAGDAVVVYYRARIPCILVECDFDGEATVPGSGWRLGLEEA